MSCTLKRCQGKRGCICPKGKIPVGCYSNSSNNNAEKAPTKLPPINNKAAAAIPTRKPIVTKKALSIINKKPVLGAKAEPKPEPKPVEEEEEEEEPEILNCDGKVIIRYNHYKKEFVIVKGSCTAIAIDEQYALSYAYPNSKIHISKLSPSDFSWEDEGLPAPPIEREKPVGVYRGLVAGEAYWVHIEEDKKELVSIYNDVHTMHTIYTICTMYTI